MDITRSHASSAPTEPQSPSEAPRSPVDAGQPDAPAATHERGGALESLAGRRRSRSPDGVEASEQAGSSSSEERPRKKLRSALRVRFAEAEAEGSTNAGKLAHAQPMARLHAMPRHEADDPDQRRINEQVAHNQRMLIDRLHVLRQPAAGLMTQDWFLAEAGQYLTPSEQHSFLNDVLHLPEQARAEFARLLPAGHAGAYLLRDEEALAHTLGGAVPDVIVRRASWLMRAGLAGRIFPGGGSSASMARAIERAEADLREYFEHAGPGSQAQAVLNLVGSVLFAPTLSDANRFTQLALQPRHFRALPEGQRATTLWLLTHSLLSANTFAWMELPSTGGGNGVAGAAPDHEANAARIEAFVALHRSGLAENLPLLLDAARGTAAPMSSNAAHGILSSLGQLARRGMPDVPAQRALLDLHDLLLDRLDSPERGPVYAGLAEMTQAFGEPGLQRRAFDLLTRHEPGASRTNDWLAHLDGEARVSVLTTMLNQLSALSDEMRDNAFGLLSDQMAPGIIERFPIDARRRLLEEARDLTLPPGDNLRLLAIVGRLLDHASIDEIEESLRVLFGHADVAPEDDALEDAVVQMWDRFLPQLPADRSGHLLAHAVAVDSAYLTFAMRRFIGVDANRLHAMLAALTDQRSQPLANEFVERGIDEPDALHATLQAILDERPPAVRAGAATSTVQVLFWAATAMPEAQRPQAMRNSARQAIRIINATPVQARAALLAAYLRPEPSGRVATVAFRYLAAAMSAGGAQQFHRWLDTVPVAERLSMATGVARLLPSIREQGQAAQAATLVEGIYPRSLASWNDHHALVGALTNTLAHWPVTFDVERLRIGTMVEHGIRALPPGPQHEQALRQLAAVARALPQGASSSGEAAPGTHAWAMQLIHSESRRTGDAAHERELGAQGDDSAG
ncbi:MAG TPA: hypothetical protein VHC91_08525 [Trinickia sp.]|uniref:hypothetical protein n=1 Tax=Trinickia sp. TaxID=2571163 RepID=UPI002BE2F2BE|nr:hypothetical protein [Trinickia sp.]HVW50439.1 hypothetical protein [Trinickia sp.]